MLSKKSFSKNRIKSSKKKIKKRVKSLDIPTKKEYLKEKIQRWDTLSQKSYNIILRWLKSKVGQNWDNIYSEICEKKLSKEVSYWVYLPNNIFIKDNIPYKKQKCRWSNKPIDIVGFWVHPETNILHYRYIVKTKYKKEKPLWLDEKEKILALKIEDIWYSFKVEKVVPTKKLYPLFKNQSYFVWVNYPNHNIKYPQYMGLYNIEWKKQLSKKELRKNKHILEKE